MTPEQRLRQKEDDDEESPEEVDRGAVEDEEQKMDEPIEAPVEDEDDDEDYEMDMDYKAIRPVLEKQTKALVALSKRLDRLEKDEPHPDTDAGAESSFPDGDSEEAVDHDPEDDEGVDDEPASDTDAGVSDEDDETTDTGGAMTAEGVTTKALQKAERDLIAKAEQRTREIVKASSPTPWAFTEKGEFDPRAGLIAQINKAVKEDREIAGRGSQGYKRPDVSTLAKSQGRIKRLMNPNGLLRGD